LPGLPLASGL